MEAVVHMKAPPADFDLLRAALADYAAVQYSVAEKRAWPDGQRATPAECRAARERSGHAYELLGRMGGTTAAAARQAAAV